MKWLAIALSFAFKNFSKSGGEVKNPIEEIKTLMAENALKIVLALIAASAIASIFVAGLVLSVLNLTSQYDLGLQPRVTAIAGAGLGMMLFSVLIFAIGVYFSTSHERKQKKQKKQHPTNDFQSAILLLVNDYIQEREFKRRNAYRPYMNENFSENPSINNIDQEEIRPQIRH